jgi:hypothetical protein
MIDRLALPADAAALWRAWNAPAAPRRWPVAPALAEWQAAASATRDALAAQPDLVTRLLGFAPKQALASG